MDTSSLYPGNLKLFEAFVANPADQYNASLYRKLGFGVFLILQGDEDSLIAHHRNHKDFLTGRLDRSFFLSLSLSKPFSTKEEFSLNFREPGRIALPFPTKELAISYIDQHRLRFTDYELCEARDPATLVAFLDESQRVSLLTEFARQVGARDNSRLASELLMQCVSANTMLTIEGLLPKGLPAADWKP